MTLLAMRLVWQRVEATLTWRLTRGWEARENTLKDGVRDGLLCITEENWQERCEELTDLLGPHVAR
jgi:hypothetical protein